MADENKLLLELEDSKQLKKEQLYKGYVNPKNCFGIFIIVVQCMCEIGSISCLQLITDLPPNFELNSLRFAIGLVFVIVYLLVSWQLPVIERNLAAWVFLGVLATYFYNLTLYSEYVKELPIGAVFGIKQGFYILLVALASRILLKQKHSWLKLFLIATTCLGIGLVILSSFLPHGETVSGNLNKCNKHDLSAMLEEDIDKVPGELKDVVLKNETKMTILCEDFPNNLTGYTTDGVLIAIALIFACMVCGTVENLVISGTPLKDVNGIFLSFWYFLFGSFSSILTSITFETMFLPDMLTDKIYSVMHCTFASLTTFLYIFALKFLDPSILAIVFSIHIPLALVTQIFLLQSITPPVELWVLILGLAIITLSVFAISTIAVCMTKSQTDKNAPHP